MEELGKTRCREKHTIRIKEGTEPIKGKFYRTSLDENKIIKEEVDKMIKEGIIVKSRSSWSSPVVIVRKKDGKPRFCVDYRKLNKIIVKDVFPLPRIDNLLEVLNEARYFSTLDLTSEY